LTRITTTTPLALSSGARSKREVLEPHVPDWGDSKRETRDGGEGRGRAFSYMVLGAAGVGYAAGAKHTVLKLLDSLNPAANVRAMVMEVDVSHIAEGTTTTVTWRGKPLCIRHRTADEIADAESAPLAEMRDPCPDAARRKADKPEWLVVIGLCTHLGCMVVSGQGQYGGWFCPCHGSHYDTALNLEVPPYMFRDDDSKLIIGRDL
jgi:ubiquinol-cytochrome c reductase iron-sulfur subunit